jgi:hypothetical protein
MKPVGSWRVVRRGRDEMGWGRERRRRGWVGGDREAQGRERTRERVRQARLRVLGF